MIIPAQLTQWNTCICILDIAYLLKLLLCVLQHNRLIEEEKAFSTWILEMVRIQFNRLNQTHSISCKIYFNKIHILF